MIYRLLADLLVIAHLLFILFVLLGGLLVLWRNWVAWLHIPAACWGVLVEFNGWICPLTPMENRLRAIAGEHSYDSGFIEHYLLPLIYPTSLTANIQLILGITVIVVNLAVYLLVIRKLQNRRSKPSPP